MAAEERPKARRIAVLTCGQPPPELYEKHGTYGDQPQHCSMHLALAICSLILAPPPPLLRSPKCCKTSAARPPELAYRPEGAAAICNCVDCLPMTSARRCVSRPVFRADAARLAGRGVAVLRRLSGTVPVPGRAGHLRRGRHHRQQVLTVSPPSHTSSRPTRPHTQHSGHHKPTCFRCLHCFQCSRDEVSASPYAPSLGAQDPDLSKAVSAATCYQALPV